MCLQVNRQKAALFLLIVLIVGFGTAFVREKILHGDGVVQSRPTRSGPTKGVSMLAAPHEAQEIKDLLSAFLQWRPSGTKCDEGNPFEQTLVELGASLTPVIAALYPSSDAVLPLAIVCILGEIGDSEAFDLLLREYLARPSMRTAVSLGSCLGALSMNKLFEAPFTPETTRGLLQHIYGDKWESVKDLSVEELRRNLSENRDAIRANCELRSMPQLG